MSGHTFVLVEGQSVPPTETSHFPPAPPTHNPWHNRGGYNRGGRGRGRGGRGRGRGGRGRGRGGRGQGRGRRFTNAEQDRHRRENVEKALLAIDYLMSKENLVKDSDLRVRMDEQGYIPLALIGNYPQVNRYNAYYWDLMNALDSHPNYTVDGPNETFRLKEGWEDWLMPGPNGVLGCPRYIKITIPPPMNFPHGPGPFGHPQGMPRGMPMQVHPNDMPQGMPQGMPMQGHPHDMPQGMISSSPAPQPQQPQEQEQQQPQQEEEQQPSASNEAEESS